MTAYRMYNGWCIVKEGGFITMTRYIAKKDNLYVWAFRLKEVKQLCDKLDKGEKVDDLYLKPLYI